MTKKRGLGRGLGALIPDVAVNEPEVPREGARNVPIEQVKTNPFQPRKSFAEEKLAELSASVKERGILQPLLVSKGDDGGYVLIAGERRLRAAHKAGLATVPVIIKAVDDRDRQEIALIENIQREDLNVVEEAEAFQDLIRRFNYTQEAVSQKVGKSRTAVTNSLRLLKLAGPIKEDLVNDRITMGHARSYLGLESVSMQKQVHGWVVKRGLSVRQTENIIKKIKSEQNETSHTNKKPGSMDTHELFMTNELQKRFSTKVKIHRSGKRGKIVIEFFTDAEFERIYDLLRS